MLLDKIDDTSLFFILFPLLLEAVSLQQWICQVPPATTSVKTPSFKPWNPPWPACTGTTLGFLTSLVGRLTSMVFQKQGHDHNLKTLIYHMYVYTILCFSFMYISSIQTSNTSGYGTWFQSMSNVPWKCLSFSRLSHCRLRWISPKIKSKTARQFVVNK